MRESNYFVRLEQNGVALESNQYCNGNQWHRNCRFLVSVIVFCSQFRNCAMKR